MDEEEEILAHYCTYGSMFYIYNTRTLGLAGEVQPLVMCHPWTIKGMTHSIQGDIHTRVC
jgi:hypothetical protein